MTALMKNAFISMPVQLRCHDEASGCAAELGKGEHNIQQSAASGSGSTFDKGVGGGGLWMPQSDLHSLLVDQPVPVTKGDS